MDSNGNGDGWNNVSPFGDNGNGAYPANPNLEQAYGYGGAWGYLYFNGVLGGTNTVRSVNLYYVHGRWSHPDMGLFLSPNEKGDYLYGGDGPPEQAPADCVWFSFGFNCEFYANYNLGLFPYRSPSGYACERFEGGEFFFNGQHAVHSVSNLGAGLEFFGGGTLFVGRGRLTILLGAVAAPGAAGCH